MRILTFVLKLILLGAFMLLKEGKPSEIAGNAFFMHPTVKLALQFLIFWLTVNIIIRFLQFIYRKRKKYGNKYSDNVIVGLQNIYYMISSVALIITILAFFGVEPKELITGLSILAASIAIITKDIALDIICGIQISFSKDLAIGDYVKIGDQKGTVVDINISKIILQNENDDVIYIPNSKAYFSEMINYTKKEIRKYNLEFAIHSSQNLNNEMIRQLVFNVFENFSTYLDEQSEVIKVISVSGNEIKYKVQFKLNQVNPLIADQIKAGIMEAIVKTLQI
ncbi:MAG TPA: mechanosensitive ion channel [Saprospiraceae bacterium]|nr:mechanosensitive ion channel [Saprospiraceae bacterium]HNB30401.1 mechanosensitive ion channel [Saprospiraceae bacterium]HNG67730.1 mechanosensitive ion channel [Saprospiraceae bacterium]